MNQLEIGFAMQRNFFSDVNKFAENVFESLYKDVSVMRPSGLCFGQTWLEFETPGVECVTDLLTGCRLRW